MGKDFTISHRQDNVRELVVFSNQIQFRERRPGMLFGSVGHPCRGWSPLHQKVVYVPDIRRRVLSHIAEGTDEGWTPGSRTPGRGMAVC